MDTEELSFDAIIISETQKNVNPMIDSSGAIKNTPLQKNLKLKVGCKIMLTFNVDTTDCLTNGAFGEVLGFHRSKQNLVKKVIINFFNEDCGKKNRECDIIFKHQYPGQNATPIDRIEFPYSFSRKGNCVAKNAKVIQFPLRLAFGATSHKVQGQTVLKPNSLAVDLLSVREAAQGYVRISRPESLKQLFILDSLPTEKIYPSTIAMKETKRLKDVSLNGKRFFEHFVVSCNIRSMNNHFQDLISSPLIVGANAICLQETWLLKDDYQDKFSLLGYSAKLNSLQHGRGIATYVLEGDHTVHHIKRKEYQFTMVELIGFNLLNIYRSSSSASSSVNYFMEDLLTALNLDKKTIIVGHLNICSMSDKNHPILELFSQLRFIHNVKQPSHKDGRVIDYASHFCPNDTIKHLEVKQAGQYFTDHDMIIVNVANLLTEKI